MKMDIHQLTTCLWKEPQYDLREQHTLSVIHHLMAKIILQYTTPMLSAHNHLEYKTSYQLLCNTLNDSQNVSKMYITKFRNPTQTAFSKWQPPASVAHDDVTSFTADTELVLTRLVSSFTTRPFSVRDTDETLSAYTNSQLLHYQLGHSFYNNQLPANKG